MKESPVKKLEDKTDGLDEKNIKEEVQSAKSLIQTFLQTVKISQLYEPNHPMISRFLDNLKLEFDRYFEDLDSFSLKVGQYQLLYRGKVAYESQNLKENLAFFFFRDGIREIHFFKGLEFKELADFLGIVRKSNIINRNEGDLVTLLWEKDFFHIDFTIVDEFLDEDETFIPVTDEDLLKGLEYKGFREGLEEEGGKAKTDESHASIAAGLRQAFNIPPEQSVAQVCALNPDEMEQIYRRVEREQESDYVYTLINNLIEILLHLGENMEAYENLISYFERINKSLLEEREVGKAVMILRSLNDPFTLGDSKEKQTSAIDRILVKAGDSPSLELLGKAMEGNGEADSESILQYLQLLPKPAVDPLCSLLMGLGAEKWRRVLCDRIAELCRGEIQSLTKFLSDPNYLFLSDILRILEKVAHPSTPKYLGNLVNHEDPKVREETLKLIAKFEENGTDLVRKFLRDSVPQIRGRASRILAKMDKQRAVKPLTEIVLSEDFLKRDYEEKVSFFIALGETGSAEAIATLQKIAKEKKWFNRAQWDEMRRCAAKTLKMMGVEK